MEQNSPSFWQNESTPAEWFCVKLSMVLTVFPFLAYILYSRNELPYAAGVCHLGICNILLLPVIKYVMWALLAMLAIMYVAEIKMQITLLLIFLTAVLLFSFEESSGAKSYTGIYSLVFFAQWLAYVFYKNKNEAALHKNRMQYAAQFIAAAYVLSALSKIYYSGIGWVNHAPQMALQILKSFDYEYYTTGAAEVHDKGSRMAQLIIAHPASVKSVLLAALLLEAFAFILVLGKRTRFIYGLLLAAMHLGIYVLMNISFPTLIEPMVIICINPLYALWYAASRLRAK